MPGSTQHSYSEQLVPIFGLVALENHPPSGDIPHTTVDKLIFLFHYVILDPRAHWLTATIGFATLGILILVKILKRKASKHCTWLKWIPEVLLIVIISTSKFTLFHKFISLMYPRSTQCHFPMEQERCSYSRTCGTPRRNPFLCIPSA